MMKCLILALQLISTLAAKNCQTGVCDENHVFATCDLCFTHKSTGNGICGQPRECSLVKACSSDNDCLATELCARDTCCAANGKTNSCFLVSDCDRCRNPGTCTAGFQGCLPIFPGNAANPWPLEQVMAVEAEATLPTDHAQAVHPTAATLSTDHQPTGTDGAAGTDETPDEDANIQVDFLNDCPAPLNLYWVGVDAQEEIFLTTIPQGDMFRQFTHAGHIFRAKYEDADTNTFGEDVLTEVEMEDFAGEDQLVRICQTEEEL